MPRYRRARLTERTRDREQDNVKPLGGDDGQQGEWGIQTPGPGCSALEGHKQN